MEDLILQISVAKEVIVYHKQPLPKRILKLLSNFISSEMHPTVQVVAEDISDVTYLHGIHSSGFELFYGVGLPEQAVIFIGSGRGFVLENKLDMPGFKPLTSKAAESLYYRLLWCRFEHAASLCGSVKEANAEGNLFCLMLEREREVWCRLRDAEPLPIPDVGQKAAVFAWEKWVSHILGSNLNYCSGRSRCPGDPAL